MPNPTGFFAVLPGTIINIPTASNLSWIPLFYALPRELVEKRPVYLSLPRNINHLVASEEAQKLIEDDLFLELVWDCYAWSIWQFIQVPKQDGTYRDIPGDWKNYSGYFPLWQLCYHIIALMRDKFEHEMDWSFQKLFMMPAGQEWPWLSYKQFGNLIGNLTDMIIKEQNLQPVIDETWRNRQLEDYNGKSIYKNDFLKSWDHTRAAKKKVNIDDLHTWSEEELEAHGLSSNDEEKTLERIRLEQFKESLNDKDKQILQMKMQGCTLSEIAKQLGYSTPSAVHKRMQQIVNDFKKAES